MKIQITLEDGKKVDAHVDGMTIKTDQGVKSGGEGSAPDPFTYFLASIGTCAGFFIKSFCNQRDIPTDNIAIEQTIDYNKEKKLVEKIDIQVNLPADFPEKYKPALINAANLCSVKRHLADPPVIEVKTN